MSDQAKAEQDGGSELSEVLGVGAETRIRWSTAERPKGARWFLLRGSKLYRTTGWRSLADASEWIDSHGYDLDWRVGYQFRLRGDRSTCMIVNRLREPAKAIA